MEEKISLSKEEYQKLINEIERLETKEIKKVAEKLRHAASFGDLSENAAFENAKEEQRTLHSKIAELRSLLAKAVIVEKQEKEDKVQLGSKVLLKLNEEKINFQIVGTTQTNIKEGKISPESPLGKAILGKKVGDSGEIKGPKQKIKYKIIKIE